MSNHDKINRGKRGNSSVAGAALMLGLTADTLDHFLPLLQKADEYHKEPSKVLRDELILRFEMESINLRVEQLNINQRKCSKSE